MRFGVSHVSEQPQSKVPIVSSELLGSFQFLLDRTMRLQENDRTLSSFRQEIALVRERSDRMYPQFSPAETSTAIINISGRQRMLLQRTALFCSKIANQKSPQKRQQDRAQLRQAIAQMETGHQQLLHGDSHLGLPGITSETIRTIYFQPPWEADAKIRAYIANVKAFLASTDEEQNADHPALEPIVRAATSELLDILDHLVKQYQQEMDERNQSLFEKQQQLQHQSTEIASRMSQLYEQTLQQSRREQLVNQITYQTRQSFDTETILTETIAQLLDAMDVDRCIIHLLEETNSQASASSSNQPEVLDQFSPSENHQKREITAFRKKNLFEVCREPFSSSVAYFEPRGPITDWVIKYRQSVVIADVTQDPRIDPSNQEYQKAKIKSSLVVPVQTQDRLYGILYLNQCDRQRQWSDNDCQFAQSVADHLALSIQQSDLYAQAKFAAQQAQAKSEKLKQVLYELQKSQTQLVQAEKMSSLGQTVAGLAHEINNPINFIYGNIAHTQDYVSDLLSLLQAYQTHYPDPVPEIQDLMENIELNYICDDLDKIFHSMRTGADRIRELVLSLRNFSRLDQAEIKEVDLHEGIESTLLILSHRLKPRKELDMRKVQIIKEYGDIPPVACFAGQLNQVFMNILSNAIDALESQRYQNSGSQADTPTIWIRTQVQDGEYVCVRIADNGPGIPKQAQSSLFDPFFTTKPVGQGTGLGLSISYQIVVEKHGGEIWCESPATGERGTAFAIKLPIRSDREGNPKTPPRPSWSA